MNTRISHRGPDSDGEWHEGPVAVGHRRLSIIDLAGSTQPMVDSSGRYVVVFNGEIYNYIELRAELEKRGVRFNTRGDTEVLLAAFIAYGEGCLTILNGMFAFAVWDREAKRLFLARDRLGVKPLYYGLDRKGALAFASELQAFRPLNLDFSIRPNALSQYMRHGFIRSPETVFEGVQELRPGHFLTFDSKGMKSRRYWEPPVPEERLLGCSLDDLAGELKELFRSAVQIRLRSDVPLGAFLSGGLDSSIIVALMKELGETAIHTFSIKIGGTGFDESPFARKVASHYETQHHEGEYPPRIEKTLFDLVRHYGQPYGDSSAIPTWHLCQLTRRHVTVALSGDGGDELFCGYRRYVARKLLNWYRFVPAVVRQGAWLQRIEKLPEGTGYYDRSIVKRLKLFIALDKRVSLDPEDIYPAYFTKAEVTELLNCCSVDGGDSGSESSSLHEKAQRLGDIEAMMMSDIMHYLPDDILAKVDRASMAHALEVRSPFMDYRIVEFASRLPVDLKLRGLTTKYILRKAFERDLPKEPLTRAKHGFAVPLGDGFHTHLRAMYEDIVLGNGGERLVELRQARSLLTEHLKGNADHGHKLWLILFLHAWAHWWKHA